MAFKKAPLHLDACRPVSAWFSGTAYTQALESWQLVQTSGKRLSAAEKARVSSMALCDNPLSQGIDTLYIRRKLPPTLEQVTAAIQKQPGHRHLQ